MGCREDEMWQAVVDCDERYDGKFFYAVKTVGVYCHPSCKSRTPLRKNVCYFTTGEEAEQAGFRPCKRCRPDLSRYAPASDLAMRAKALIDNYFDQRDRLASEMKQLGVSVNHLAVVFKQQYGLPPIQYMNQIRAGQAKQLLSETDMPIIDIAGAVGYESLPAFYSFFKSQIGATPKAYRLRAKDEGFDHGSKARLASPRRQQQIREK